MNAIQLKWNITEEQKTYVVAQESGVNRIIAKAKAEKLAKVEGRWDYRNDKIVEA